MMKRVLLSLLMLVAACINVHAENASQHHLYAFETAAQEEAFNELILELRCPKCQNQNLMDSDAEISQDMKRRIHGMLLKGQSQEEIVETLRARYGDFITYQPPFNLQTAFLWLFPAGLLALLLFVLLRKLTRSNAQGRSSQAVSEEQPEHDKQFANWLAQQQHDTKTEQERDHD
ncbi:MAG: cytochrome c-type biogenesis protein [Pseudomonadota bacterium]